MLTSAYKKILTASGVQYVFAGGRAMSVGRYAFALLLSVAASP